MDKETEERVNKPIPFQEFPKMLHHPDGRTAIANDPAEEKTLLRGDYCPTPDDALDVRAERDEAAAKRQAAQIAKASKDAEDSKDDGKKQDKG